MIVNFNGNPQTSIIVFYCPTNICIPTEIENFYENLTYIEVVYHKTNSKTQCFNHSRRL